jgi:hypothetical protein
MRSQSIIIAFLILNSTLLILGCGTANPGAQPMSFSESVPAPSTPITTVHTTQVLISGQNFTNPIQNELSIYSEIVVTDRDGVDRAQPVSFPNWDELQRQIAGLLFSNRVGAGQVVALSQILDFADPTLIQLDHTGSNGGRLSVNVRLVNNPGVPLNTDGQLDIDIYFDEVLIATGVCPALDSFGFHFSMHIDDQSFTVDPTCSGTAH